MGLPLLSFFADDVRLKKSITPLALSFFFWCADWSSTFALGSLDFNNNPASVSCDEETPIGSPKRQNHDDRKNNVIE